ncbi:hypothetical protein GIB67_035838 [Kingdonia uniflora]|uniref:Uncharacterized protein n=1 Tax=Kingdonia uniflora TaxID=39325 RepID=A0A7J7MJP6_9MAGN|nr:hypothetical protein GIB67_035838 [Kingdonia uniflora]
MRWGQQWSYLLRRHILWRASVGQSYLAKKISVAASSPPSRYTDPKALVSRAFQETSFAGPRIEDKKNCAWWMLDIGQDHQVYF